MLSGGLTHTTPFNTHISCSTLPRLISPSHPSITQVGFADPKSPHLITWMYVGSASGQQGMLQRVPDYAGGGGLLGPLKEPKTFVAWMVSCLRGAMRDLAV